MKDLAQIICITESWLTPDISQYQTELSGYTQCRTDGTNTNNESGGGIICYIENNWSKQNDVIYSHSCSDCDIMTIKSTPRWSPREFSSVITISCYTPFTRDSRLKSVSAETIKTITDHVAEIEQKYTDAAILIMGDFNQLPIKFNNYHQIVTKPTRKANIIDKCFVKVENAYSRCDQLPGLGKSDHNIMHLVPTYTSLSRSKPQVKTKRMYSEENCEKLRACLDDTDWDSMLTQDKTLNQRVEVFTDYINFCTDVCVPFRYYRHQPNSKPWVTPEIINLVDEKTRAFQSGDRNAYQKLKRQVHRDIYHSKKKYTKNIQEKLANEPARAWTDIHKLSGMWNDTSTEGDMCDIDPDKLNGHLA
jgi:hypothetical protein